MKTINPDLKIEIITIDDFEIMVVDDFLASPNTLRHFAIKAHERRNKPNNKKFTFHELPRVQELHITPAYFEEAYRGFDEKVKELINTHMGAAIAKHYGLNLSGMELHRGKGPYFHIVYQPPRFLPHVDTGNVSTILYLNTPPQCWGGTAIYRHVPTNMLYSDQSRTYLDWLCQKPIEHPLTTSTEEWKLEALIEMKYNRFVAFNSSMIHKIFWPDDNSPYRKNIKLARLTLNNFYTYA